MTEDRSQNMPIEINHYPVVAYCPNRYDGVVIVNRGLDATFEDATFVTWRVWQNPGGDWIAENGHYDLNWEQAIIDFKGRI